MRLSLVITTRHQQQQQQQHDWLTDRVNDSFSGKQWEPRACVCLMKTFSGCTDRRTYGWQRFPANPDPPAGPTHPDVSIRRRLNPSKILIPVRGVPGRRRSPAFCCCVKYVAIRKLERQDRLSGSNLVAVGISGDDRLNQIFIRNGLPVEYTERICLVSSYQSQQHQRQILSIVDYNCVNLVIVI